MMRAGHHVETISLDLPGAAIDSRLQSTVCLLGPSYGKYGFAWRLEPWLRENLRKYDVAIVHGIWTYHSYCVGKVARQLGVPYVVFAHGMLDPWFARAFPLKHLKKWLYWPWAEYRVLRDAALVLFTTEEEMRLARRSFWLYKARERLVGYGIGDRPVAPGLAKIHFLSAFPHLADKRNFLFLSRLHPKKGVDLLIRAFSRIASSDERLHLVLAGPGDPGYLQTLKNMVLDAGLGPRVTFTGMLLGAIKWGAYDAAEAFVLPSHQENFGIVIAEALSSSLPVLTTRQVNIWAAITEDGVGFVEDDTQDGIDRLLNRWLALTHVERGGMQVAARECFVSRFHVDHVTANLLTALQDAVQYPSMSHTFTGPGSRTG